MIAERVLMGLLLGGLGIGCAFVLYPFFSAMLWAGILVFTTWPACTWLRVHARLGRAGAALAMVAIVAVLVVVPLTLAAPAGAADVNILRHQLEDLIDGGLPPAPHWLFHLPLAGPTLTDYWNAWAADLSAMVAFFRPYLGMIAENGLHVLLGIANGVVQFMLALFIAFFFWFSGDALGIHLQSIARRITGAYADDLIAVTGKTVRGTVYGILGTALVQGLLTTAGLAVAGVPRPVLFGVIAAFLAVLPIGAPLVWIPAGLWLLASGATGRGIFLLAYGVVAISGSDHIIRPYFIARGAQLPYLLTVLGVLGGVLAFGALGIFLGPVLLGVGFTLMMEFARAGERNPAPADWR